MKFYGNGSVYIPGKAKCIRFVDGMVEAEKSDADFLIEAGYKHDAEVDNFPKSDDEKAKLIEKAKSIGIDVKGNWGVKKLTEEIARLENGN